MTEQEYVEQKSDAESRLSRLLTPKATAVASFAFAVFGMQGQGTWTQALQTLFWGAGDFPQSQVLAVLTTWGVATLLMAAVAALLAFRTLHESSAASSWEGHLARAAVIVAGIGALLSVVGILAGLARGAI